MKYLVVEDEINACQYIRGLIQRLRPKSELLAHIDSVEETINWLHDQKNQPDLIFMDIQLSDGIGFEIFNHVDITAPVIFTTAFDQFAVQAFKVNGLDYLLKPIESKDLESAIIKYEQQQSKNDLAQLDKIKALVKSINREKKNRFLIKKGNHFEFIDVDQIAFVHSEDSITFLFTKDGKRHLYAKTVTDLEMDLDPLKFFRINRGQLIHIESIQKIHPYFNQRLKLELSTSSDIEFIVSRNKTMDFKSWVDS